MSNYSDLTRFAKDLDKAAKEAQKRFKDFRKTLADRYLEHLDKTAPADVEGRLRASLKKRPWRGQKEWVEKQTSEGIEVGTSVYYASMVNDGHVVGKRDTKATRSHRRMAADDRQALASASGKGWVSGVFFREQAEDAMDAELPRMLEDLAEDILEEVSR